MFRTAEELLCSSRTALFLMLLLAVLIPHLRAEDSLKLLSARIPHDRLSTYSDLAVQWVEEYLRIDTTNPPGHELGAAQFFKDIFDHEAIENQVFEYQPGRADFWA